MAREIFVKTRSLDHIRKQTVGKIKRRHGPIDNAAKIGKISPTSHIL